ncbi:MAG TPA: hypothetical protein VJQ51_13430 [Burkholderiales bacterium]|nr:hypothetical protein [Burkholderiales bacterium]
MNRLHYDSMHFTTTAAVALAAFGLGAAIMYILDPDSGRRRRAYAKDRALDAADDAMEAITSTARGVRNRAQDTMADVESSARGLRNRAQDTLSDVKLTSGQ